MSSMRNEKICLSFCILHSAFCILFAGSVSAEERRNAGLVAPIPSTITTEATSRLRSALYGPLRRYEDERNRDPKNVGSFYLLCDFNPDNRDNASDDFGACLTLARALRDLQKKQGVQVVAYVHGKVTRHAVLPLLACSEIILSKEPAAQFGKIAEPEKPLDELDREAYDKIPIKHYPAVLIHKMYDKNVEVIKTRQGDYRDARDKPRPQGEPVSGLGAGDTVLYSFAQARDLSLCQPIPRNSIDEVRERYQLPPGSLYPSLDRIVAWRILVSGPITGELKEKVKRRVRKALGLKANVLILELACGDGESQAAHELAVFLSEINDSRREPVETIAYVTRNADNTATFLAFACNKIVMQREIKQGGQVVQKGARLGDFDRYMQAHPGLEATVRRNLAEIAAKKHYPPILAEGMLDRKLGIVAVESTKEESARKFISEAELKADQQGERRWRSVGVVKPAPPPAPRGGGGGGGGRG
jgi:membrane-bound serine protease (ClpP class)